VNILQHRQVPTNVTRNVMYVSYAALIAPLQVFTHFNCRILRNIAAIRYGTACDGPWILKLFESGRKLHCV